MLLSIIQKCLFFSFLLFAPACQNQSVEYVKTNAIERGLRPAVVFTGQETEYVLSDRMHRYGVSALSIAIVKDGKLVLSKAYGTPSFSDDRAITPDTLFQAASLSKAITALGVLKLSESDGFSLNTPANELLSLWKIPESEYTQDNSISVAELLSHTAGINVPSYQGYKKEEPLPTLDDVLTGRLPSNADAIRPDKPQGKYAYSGGGYLVLEKMIEDQTSLSFNQFMTQTVFEPALAKNSSFARYLPDSSSRLVALGHSYSGEEHDDGWLVYPQSAAAGLWSTPTDIAKVLIEFIDSYSGAKNRLLSQETASLLAEPVVDSTGLGFGVHGEGINLHLDHSGWNRGYRAYMLVFPQRQDAIVVMTNGDYGNRLIDEIVRSVDAELGWGVFTATEFEFANWEKNERQQLAGVYQMIPANFEVEIKEIEDHFILSTPRSSTHQLYPISNQELIMVEDGTRIKIDEKTRALEFWGMTARRKY